MSPDVSRRQALVGSAAAALGLGVGAVAASTPSPDAALIARADAFWALRAREDAAWAALSDEESDDGPEIEACRALSDALREAGEALADVPAAALAGLGTKASAMLMLVGSRLDTQANLSEHAGLVVSILRDAARLGGGAHA